MNGGFVMRGKSFRGVKRAVTAVMAAALMITSICGVVPGAEVINEDVTKTASAATVRKSGDFKYVKYLNGVKISKYTGKAKKLTIPAKIAGKKVVAIEEGAFKDNTKIKQVKMPKTMRQIGMQAFAGCTKLKKVTFTNKLDEIGQAAFSGSGLTKITIPKGIDEIAPETFADCKKLKTVVLGEEVSAIGERSFAGCEKLQTINLDNVEEIRSKAFENDTAIAGNLVLKNVVSIDENAFYGCTGIASVDFSDSLQVLGNEYERSNPFSYCSNITAFNVDINNANYTSVDGVIYNKTKDMILAYPAKKGGIVNVPENVTEISAYAFSGAQISAVNMCKGLNTIGKEAFGGSTVAEVTMPLASENVVLIWKDDAFIDCKALRKVVFPEGTKTTGQIAFINCTALTEVVLPESVTEISPVMFFGCTALQNVSLPKGVKKIPVAAFYGCKALNNVNLDNIENIREYAFFGCEGLAGVLNLNAKTIDACSFGNCINITEVNLNKAIENDLNADITYDVEDFCKEFLVDRNLIDNEIEKMVQDDVYATYPNAFAGCSALTKINANGGGVVKSVDGVLFTDDMKCLIAYPASLTGKYNVPYGVTTIGSSAFYGSSLSEIVCSNSVCSLATRAFYKSKLKAVTISKSVSTVSDDYRVFEDCTELERIDVHSSNPYFESVDGVLYLIEDDVKTLLVYPSAKQGKTFEIPEKRKIAEHAFSNCKFLKKLYMNDMKLSDGIDIINACSGIKLYLPKKFTTDNIEAPETGKYTIGIAENCTGCKVYVKKKSAFAKKLDKKKIKYRKY